MLQRVPIPNTALNVSALCCGTGGFGTDIQGEKADSLVAAFMEAGGNFFDTAHVYAAWLPDGAGKSERELGASLRRLGLRDQAIIATKGCHPAFGNYYPRPKDYLSERVLQSDVQESLERLGIAQIGLYLLHRDDGVTPVAEVIGMLNRAVARGSIGCFGTSNWSVSRMAEANDYARANGLHGFVVSEVQWSLARPNWEIGPEPTTRYVAEEEIRWHSETGIPILAYSATAGGYFAGNPASEGLYGSAANAARRERARKLAAEMNCTPAQVAIAYLMNQRPTVFPLFGTSNQEHLGEILGAAGIQLSSEQIGWLEEGEERT